MSWTGLDIMKTDRAIVKICGHSFDPSYLAMVIEKQAIFPRLRSEYGCTEKRSGFKSSSIFSSWFRYGPTMGDLSR